MIRIKKINFEKKKKKNDYFAERLISVQTLLEDISAEGHNVRTIATMTYENNVCIVQWKALLCRYLLNLVMQKTKMRHATSEDHIFLAMVSKSNLLIL